jgi:lipopolysaccharide export system protein LptA
VKTVKIMRILVLLAATLVLAAIGFVVYWTMQSPDGRQPQNPRAGGKHLAATLPSSGEGFGPGERVWWNRYDAKGERTSRIRVSRYKPLKDGRFFVNDPETDFFLHNGQVLHLEGKTGYIITQENIGRGKNSPAGAPNRSPRSGDLKEVVLKLFEDESMDKPPTMVMTMNNASFDNETFRIQTEDFEDAKGNRVPGDRVPIQMRGDDYDFDGLGLRLQYNEVDRRLEYLKVFHGQRLLIKHPGNFRQQRTPATRAAAAFIPIPPIAGIALAAADPSAVREAAPKPAPRDAAPRRPRPQVVPATRPKEEHPAPVYRAVFKDSIVITQLDQRLATADEMHVDFVSESDDLVPGASTTQPSSRSSTTRPARAGRTRAGLAVPDTSGGAGPTRTKPTTRQLASAATHPATKPTTNPADQPLEIVWTGPLTITPILGDRPDRIAPGEAIVKLIAREGRFVELNREANAIKSNIKAGTITHWTLDQGARMEAGPGVPVEMTDTRGTHITTRTMLFSQADGTALLLGKSHAELPTEEGTGSKTLPPNARPEMMAVDWLERCTLYFEGDDPDNLIINRADLVGAVGVKTKQIQMNSDALNLHFAPPQAPPTAPAAQPTRTSPALRQLDAFGNVKSILTGPNGPGDIRKLDCDDLKLRTARAPDGRLYARSVDAIGHVHTIDPKSELTAGNLHAVLGVPSTQPTTKPTTRPGRKADMDTGELESLVAHDNVHAIMDDGSTADADRLDISVKDGKKAITLQGQPAIVTRKTGTLIGEIIHIVPDLQQLSVTGPGRMDGVQRSAPDQPARPVTVIWERNLLGHDNVIECVGGVIITTIGSDGSKDIARGRQVTLTTTRPTTQPATQPAGDAKLAQKLPTTQPLASAKKPTTKPSDFDVMGDREIESVILDGSAQVTSTITDASGALIQMRHIDAERMEFYQTDPRARRLVIPVPGAMITVDNRPPSTQPAAGGDDDPMSMRGQLGFKWGKSLIYDESQKQVVMSGGVLVVRQEQDPKAAQTRMTGDTLTADVEPPPQPATKPTTKPAGAPASPAAPMKMQVKKVHVEGSVDVVNGGLHLKAETMDYDPEKHVMTARGSGRKRVQKINDKDMEEASFDEFVYDTAKGTVISSKNAIFTEQK